MNRIAGLVMALGLVIAACSSGEDPVVIVDSVPIERASFDELHATPEDLDEDDRVGTVLILILRQAFATQAERDLDLAPSTTEVDSAYEALAEPLRSRGDLAEVLAARNETEARLRINAELDVYRDRIGAHLVQTESGGFDLALAEQAFRLANAEVCIRQIQLADQDAADAALARLEGGEAFDAVARDVSIDPFVARDEGVGAGGDLGCSAPAALPEGLDTAVLDAPLDQPTGPVSSAVGIHVIEVYDRTEPDLEARHDDVVDAAVPVQGPELFRRWAVDVLTGIDVEVDEAFGRWGVLPETRPVPTVVPPYRFGDIVADDSAEG